MRTDGLEQRYKLTPQMLEYDKIRQFIHPYISQSNEPLLNNSVLSTDKYGTRITISRGKKLAEKIMEKMDMYLLVVQYVWDGAVQWIAKQYHHISHKLVIKSA